MTTITARGAETTVFQTAVKQNGYYASKLSTIRPVYSSESFTLPSDKASRYPPYPGPAVILAHANTRKHLSTTTRVEGWNFTFPPSPAGAIPAEVFADERTVQINGTTIALKHYAPAHTDSDISVHFTEADIFHVADTFWNGYYPFIDYSTGGSIDGMIRATEVNLAKVTDPMIVIPGHGAIGDKSQLAFYRDLLVGTRERVAALKKQGKSLDEIVAAKPTAATDAKWGNGFRSPKDFIGDVFQGV